MVRRILVCDDDQRLARLVGGFLGQRGYEVDIVADGDQALEALERLEPNVLITDVQMPGLDGFELLRRVRSTNPACAVIMMTGYGSVEAAGRAKQLGALHYLQKPFPPEDLLNILDRLKKGAQPFAARARFPEMVGESAGMREVFAKILQVANSDLSVLVTGETGTGKGEVAKAIHQMSPRRDRAFVETNCGALPDSIVESELFGHERGAFTGASTSRKGRFELADEGTLFLDEVGDLSGATQVKLLRVIQSGEFERVGGSQTLRVDTRLITATNRNLEEMVEEGSYRQDLFYRLNVVAIKIPPLRECRDDIPLLVNEFLREFCVENDKELRGMSPEVMDLLTDYYWPGNVRELKNCLEGMVVMAKAGVELSEADIPAPIRKAPRHQSAGGITAGRTMLEIEREAIVVTLKAVDYDRRRAAQMLGIGLSTLYRKEKEYGLRTVSGDDS